MSVSDNVIEFRPSADFTVADDGVRDVALVFLGASLVVGVGDPKGQGWVTKGSAKECTDAGGKVVK